MLVIMIMNIYISRNTLKITSNIRKGLRRRGIIRVGWRLRRRGVIRVRWGLRGRGLRWSI